MSLTTKLREYRARDKLSQEELARKVGVRRETIGNLENGKYNPSLKLAMDIANVFAGTVESLFHCHSPAGSATPLPIQHRPGGLHQQTPGSFSCL